MKQDIICTGPPDAEALGAAVGEFLRTVRPERQRLYDYYRGEQSVDKGETVRGHPDNRLRAPFPRYITEVHTGYFLGLPPTVAYGGRRQRVPLLPQADGGRGGRHRHLLPGGAADRRGPAASADGFGEEAGRGAGKHHAPRRQDRQ